MKIEVFSGSNRKILEEEINLFIQDKQVITIAQSENNNGRNWYLTITILYQ